MNKGKVIWIVTEGETDQEFYKKVIKQLRINFNDEPFKVKSLDFYCAKGIGNFSKKIPNAFKRNVVDVYPDCEKIVFLCYDVDVFDYASKPPINRVKLVKELSAHGADKIYHIKADKSIEDFFLIDKKGIINNLRLGKKYKLTTGLSGLNLLKKMYKDANRTYFKGEKTDGLINSLDMNLIIKTINERLYNLCIELGYEYDKVFNKK